MSDPIQGVSGGGVIDGAGETGPTPPPTPQYFSYYDLSHFKDPNDRANAHAANVRLARANTEMYRAYAEAYGRGLRDCKTLEEMRAYGAPAYPPVPTFQGTKEQKEQLEDEYQHALSTTLDVLANASDRAAELRGEPIALSAVFTAKVEVEAGYYKAMAGGSVDTLGRTATMVGAGTEGLMGVAQRKGGAAGYEDKWEVDMGPLRAHVDNDGHIESLGGRFGNEVAGATVSVGKDSVALAGDVGFTGRIAGGEYGAKASLKVDLTLLPEQTVRRALDRDSVFARPATHEDKIFVPDDHDAQAKAVADQLRASAHSTKSKR